MAMADTTQLCYNAMGRAGGRYVTLEPFRSAIAETRPLTIEPSRLLALTVFGRKVDIGGEYSRDARPDDHEFALELTYEPLFTDVLVIVSYITPGHLSFGNVNSPPKVRSTWQSLIYYSFTVDYLVLLLYRY
ncbi:hypothetical protein VN97_g6884 [Penicillium thymicola]|uniref:Uncharacterized protein n=1 Tax=Penicillium thymicola TaxID=293382 RepID=A0AAI9TFL4_PENTH|nr:hypothetical protein VN97_g6884 [Penicillium thymicola]